MASTKDEVKIKESGRRTRSGRNSSVPKTSPLPTRSTKKGTKRHAVNEHDHPKRQSKEAVVEICDDVREEEDNIILVCENIIYDGTEINEEIIGNDQQEQEFIEPILEEQIIEEIPQEQDDCIIYEEVVRDSRKSDDAEMYVQDAELPHVVECGIDDKSSSFPFGTIEPSETSEDHIEEVCEGTAENSLLASLVGDNANSLPSVGGCEEQDSHKANFDKKEIYELDNTSSGSHVAIAENIEGADVSNATLVNIEEIVSDDELPLPSKPEINDAEEVSDEELPAPQRAELPADAEVISEDELPTNPGVDKKSPSSSPSNKKYKTVKTKRRASEMDKKDNGNKNKKGEEYNPMSPTSESNDAQPIEKKTKSEDNDTIESKEKGEKDKDREREREREREKEKEKEKEKKKLPDLEKYWRAVKLDPADFTGWTYLLQYVDNESDAEAAREAYDAFLSQYPYCYGYWRKYADYEKRKGIKANCNAIFERGLEAIPLSVDLWIHYLAHVKSLDAANEEYIRQQFERAVEACGLEFRSDKLWDAFIKWETEGKHFDRVFRIYDRLLSIPTYSYGSHFVSFQDFVNQHSIVNILTSEELKKLRLELRETSTRSSKSKSAHNSGAEQEEDKKLDSYQENETKSPNTNIETDEHNSVDEQSKDNIADISTLTKEEESAIREKVLSLRRKIHKQTVAAVTARWTFEEGIKRPYFHVKPLERCQLKNWLDYLDFEIEKGDRKRILVLFERCLIACALYDEFWLKMIRYLETQLHDPEMIALTSDVFRRACTIHHPDKPSLHLLWAAFEECQSNFNGAAEILTKFEKKCTNYLQLSYRRINLERRRGDLNKCRQLYEHYINSAENKSVAGSLVIKYARFLNKICNDLDEGLRVLRQALEKDSSNARIALQMIDLALQRDKVDEEEVAQIMDKFMSRDSIDPEQKVLFAQRKVEFLEDFGSTAKGLQEAQRALQIALNKANEAKKKRESSPSRKSTATSKENTVATGSSSGQAVYNNGSSTNANANYYNSNNSAYYGQTNSGNYQQPYDNYYNQWQYGTNYSGYNQWGSYSNYYNN